MRSPIFLFFLSHIPSVIHSLVIDMAAVAVAMLRRSLFTTVVGQSLRAIRNLAVRDDNKILLGNAGACEGESLEQPGFIFISHLLISQLRDTLACRLLLCCRPVPVMVAVVVRVLRGTIGGGVAVQGLWIIRYLADNVENRRLLGAAGACKGEWMSGCFRTPLSSFPDIEP